MLLILARFLSVWAGTPFPIDLVTADSMSPTLMEGDIVAWTPTNIEDVEIGDVVVFKSYINWPGEKLVVHRVVDIKTDSHGRPILETKGDANEWIDQAGPHIPEPYIREDHLMGKTLSIGKQPLKIPFIGIIGLWINQGLESLSQPALSKGILSYVGIFAPLTISAVILVILIFIIPEKAETIKEKLRLLIFGPKHLNFKKTIVLFLVAYVLFLTVIHCFAYDSASASVGIERSSTDSTVDFGWIKRGETSFGKNLPLTNPSMTSVKGIAFGRGNISEYVVGETFELEPAEYTEISLKAHASNESQNGSYVGEIMIYSSSFWMLFPDDFIQGMLDWNAGATLYLLDILSALILTSITIFLLTSITFILENYKILAIDLSWSHASKPILKKGIVERTTLIKRKIKRAVAKHIGWVTKTDIAELDTEKNLQESFKKPIIASLVTIPILFLIADQISAMLIASIIAGIIAYFLTCKMRKKIIITAVLVVSIATTYMMINANIILVAKGYTMLELISLSLGAIGVYLLLFAILLIPLSLLSWSVTHIIRNLKEEKEPLLILEGRCDL